MHDVDFLPAHYRQRRENRQRKPWQIAVIVACGLLMAAAAYGQYHTRRRIEEDLAAVGPYYEMAARETKWLDDLRQQLQRERSRAELLTYLRHPWPRTQILAAILQPLPEEITLERVRIRRDLPPGKTAPPRPALERPASEDQPKDLLPSARYDLKTLREEDVGLETIVTLTGSSSTSEAPYAYFNELEGCDLFVQVDPGKVEPEQGDRWQRHGFDLTLIVRPGYGRPGSPD